MAAEPKGAAATVPPDFTFVLSPSPPHGTIGCPGRKGAKCFATPILPTPGPPGIKGCVAVDGDVRIGDKIEK